MIKIGFGGVVCILPEKSVNLKKKIFSLRIRGIQTMLNIT